MKKKNQGSLKFPVAKIKKIIQCNEEIGKIQHSIPFVIGKSMELFLCDLLQESQNVAIEKNKNKLSVQCIKKVIDSQPKYQFLQFLTKDIPEFQEKKSKTKQKKEKQIQNENEDPIQKKAKIE